MEMPLQTCQTMKSFQLLLFAVLTLVEGEMRNNLSGKHLRVYAVHFPPTICVEQHNGTFHISGALTQQVEWLSRRLNFSYSLAVGANNTVGVEENGTWSGLMGQLQRHEVDLAVYPFIVALNRVRVQEPVAFVAGDHFAILAQYPKAQVLWTAPFEPFSTQVWGWWILSFIAVAMAFLVITYLYFTHVAKQKLQRAKAIDDMLIYVICVITAQGGFYRFGIRTLSVLATCWCLAACVFVYVYNSTLVSHLATSYKSPEINSLQQLASNPSIRILTLRGTASENTLLSATAGTSKILGDKLRACANCRVTSAEEFAKRIKDGPYAGLVASATCTMLVRHTFEAEKSCRLTLAYEKANWRAQFLGVPKSSPFIEEFNRESLWAHAFGLPYKWKSFYPDFEPCKLNYNRQGVEVKTRNRRLTMNQFYAPLLILLVGYAAACVVFAWENF